MQLFLQDTFITHTHIKNMFSLILTQVGEKEGI